MTDEPFASLIRRVREFIRAHDRGRDLFAASEPAAFEDLARDLFAAQFSAVRPYQALCQARGITPATLGDWRDIPAVPTPAFKEFDFTSLPPGESTGVFHSSGTTGAARSRHFHGADSLALYEESVRAWFQPHLLPEVACAAPRVADTTRPDGAPIGNAWRFLFLAPPAHEVPHSSLAHMFTHVAERWGGSNPVFLAHGDAEGRWHLDAERTREILAASGASAPVVLLGTAFLFVHLLDELGDWSAGFQHGASDSNGGASGRRPALRFRAFSFVLPPGSRVLETGGYKGRSREVSRAELYAGITRCLGIPTSHIISEYGMSELSSQAYDAIVPGTSTPAAADNARPFAPSRHFRFPPWARARVMSPEDGREVADGEVGLLRVVDLANVRSVMAVQTEDLVIRRGEGFVLLGRLPRAEAKGCSLLAT
jgi:hypothetical protein